MTPKKLVTTPVWVALLLAGCGGGDQSDTVESTTTVSADNVIEVAARACDARTSLRDDGDTIVLDTEGEEEHGGDPYPKVACVLAELDMPDRVMEAIDNTRAMDGQLEDSWDELRARWSYHPDTGLNLTIWIAT